MVLLAVPGPGDDRYIIWNNSAIGPFDLTAASSDEVIDLPSSLATIDQSKGLWHENNVQHTKVTGDIKYHPILLGALRAPSSSYPDQMTFPTYTSAGSPTTLTVRRGLVSHHRTSRYIISSTGVDVYAWERNPVDSNLWNRYEIITHVSGATNVNVFYFYEMLGYERPSVSGVYIRYRRTSYVSPIPYLETPFDFTRKQSFEAVAGLFSGLEVQSINETSTLCSWYRARKVTSDYVFSPSLIAEHVDAIAAQMVPEEFPIPDVHYGDLAMKASEKSISNKANMLEFLKDLRHPTKLIPKLRNLRSIKGIANTYLGVEYGVMPTISDLKSIVNAFKRLGPYIDSNGFDTYSAGSFASLVKGETFFSLEQHIKLAIGDEDSGLSSLLSRLESMGTLPTLENIWDLVPYSFIIDWFVDVGELLERVDTNLRLLRLDIRYVTMSRKAIISGFLVGGPEAPYTGPVDLVQYHRWVSDQCPAPPLALQTTFQDFDHWLESGALLVQRTKR